MRALLYVGGGILIGVGLSYGDAALRAEKKVREAEANHWKEWADNLEINSYPMAEAPAETEEELIFNVDGAVLEQEVNPTPPGYIQEYVEKANVYGDNAHMVKEQALEIIDDEQYAEDDGRGKEQIQVFMGDGDPYFVQDGMVIEDHKEKVGDNILVMFWQNFGPDSKERVIYIRNNQRGEDYEVIQEMGP